MTKEEFIIKSKTFPKELNAKIIAIGENDDVLLFERNGNEVRLKNFENGNEIEVRVKNPWYKRIFGKEFSYSNSITERICMMCKNDGKYFITLNTILSSNETQFTRYNRKSFCVSVHNALRKYDVLVITEETTFLICK